MGRKDIIRAIAQDLASQAKQEDKDRIKEWVGEEKTNLKLYQLLRYYFLKHRKDNADVRYNSLVERINSSANQPKLQITETMIKLRPKQVEWMKYAAVLAMVLGLGWLVFLSSQEQETKSEVAVEKENPKGRKSEFYLPDGSRVKLNADSELRYVGNESQRLIYLKGEAFFSVERDESKPFSVLSGSISTTALGTSFNVRAYSQDQFIEVFLLNGKVEVQKIDSESSPMILDDGMGAIYNTTEDLLVRGQLTAEKALAWEKGILLFDNATLPIVIDELQRWFGVDISTTNSGGNSAWSYSGRFENESLDNVLYTISHIEGFTYKIENKKVTIKL